MKKYLITGLVCIIMVLNTFGVCAYEYTPYIGDGVISATLFDVVYENVTVSEGVENVTEAEGVADADRVSASCMVKPGMKFESQVKVMMIIAGYNDGCLIDYSVSKNPVILSSAADSAKKVSASLDFGANNFDDIEIFIWDDVDNARPLLNYGNAIDAENGLEAVIVGGELAEIDEDTKTGTVTVNAGFVEWPDVVVLNEDSASKVKIDVKGTFPLSKPSHVLLNSNTQVGGISEEGIVTVTVGDEVYTITVTQEIPQITDVAFRVFVSDMGTTEATYYADDQLKIQYDVQNPVWTDSLPGPHKEIVGKSADGTVDNVTKYAEGVSSLENISYAYPPTSMKMFFFDIAPELIGSQYFAPPFTSGVTNSDYVDSYTFTIDRSARIYMNHSGKALDSSWTPAVSRFQKDAKMEKCMYYEFRQSTTSNSLQFSTGNAVYYKDYYVNPGETCTITLPSDKLQPKIFVKYADTEYITNVKYTYDDVVTITDTVEVCSPVFVDDTLTTGKYKPYNNGNTNKSEAVYGTGNLMYCTSTFLDDTSTRRVYGLAVVPEELVGGRAILTPFNAGGLSNVEFDISTSSRVYIFTTTSSAGRLAKLLEILGEGWVNTSFTHEDTDLNDKDIAIAYRSSDSAINENIKNERSFYKEFYVQPDDKAHISIPLSTYGLEGQKAVIIIKPLSE